MPRIMGLYVNENDLHLRDSWDRVGMSLAVAATRRRLDIDLSRFEGLSFFRNFPAPSQGWGFFLPETGGAVDKFLI